MIVVEIRQGIGLDIEHNSEVCYIADTEDERTVLLGFQGIIITVPFFKIHIGDFNEILEFKHND